LEKKYQLPPDQGYDILKPIYNIIITSPNSRNVCNLYRISQRRGISRAAELIATNLAGRVPPSIVSYPHRWLAGRVTPVICITPTE